VIRVLVTGSSGRAGSAICAALKHQGFAVRGTDRKPGPHTSVVVDLGDLTRGDLAGVDAIVHTAALHAPHVGVHPEREFRRINVDGTAHMLDLANGRRFVFTSSTSVYGNALVPDDAAVWVTEALAPQPRDIYDETKIAAERLVSFAGTGIVLRMARCFPEPPLEMAVHRMHRGVALADVVSAHLAAIRSRATGVVNIAGPYRFCRDDMEALWTSAPEVIAVRYPQVPAAFAARGWRLPARLDRVYVSDAAQRVLNWTPTRTVDECLRPAVVSD
jgi:nucleoside-diphosphate-sugar epimerase